MNPDALNSVRSARPTRRRGRTARAARRPSTRGWISGTAGRSIQARRRWHRLPARPRFGRCRPRCPRCRRLRARPAWTPAARRPASPGTHSRGTLADGEAAAVNVEPHERLDRARRDDEHGRRGQLGLDDVGEIFERGLGQENRPDAETRLRSAAPARRVGPRRQRTRRAAAVPDPARAGSRPAAGRPGLHPLDGHGQIIPPSERVQNGCISGPRPARSGQGCLETPLGQTFWPAVIVSPKPTARRRARRSPSSR